jgi:hypothetical protein
MVCLPGENSASEIKSFRAILTMTSVGANGGAGKGAQQHSPISISCDVSC